MPSVVTIDSPVGPIAITGDTSLTSIRFGAAPAAGSDRVVATAAAQLAAYFAGDLKEFDLPLRAGGTPFQQAVWEQLTHIPYGAVSSYGEIARRVGRPTGSRAVGAANGRNPLAIVVPCHRVIGADGTLTGYAGELWRKEWLLAHEGSILDHPA